MLHCSYQKKTEASATGGGPPPENLTPAEELAPTSNRGRPLGPPRDMFPKLCGISMQKVLITFPQIVSLSIIMMVCLYLSVMGDTFCLLDPQTTEDIPNPCVSSCIQFHFLSMEILCIYCKYCDILLQQLQCFSVCSLMAPAHLRHSMMKLCLQTQKCHSQAIYH